jgi:hypothetical protein
MKEQITLSGCNYIYIQENNEFQLFYDEKDTSWREDLRGKLATKIIDTGNDLKIIQEKKNRLDYSEASEIKFLLNKILR